jgi:hypothetical protein
MYISMYAVMLALVPIRRVPHRQPQDAHELGRRFITPGEQGHRTSIIYFAAYGHGGIWVWYTGMLSQGSQH